MYCPIFGHRERISFRCFRPILISPCPTAAVKNIVDENYITMSGASVATPLISGAAALLLAENPHTRPAEIKRLLLQKAKPFGGLLTAEVCRTI